MYSLSVLLRNCAMISGQFSKLRSSFDTFGNASYHISMMFTASAPVLYFYSEGLYNVNKMLTRTNFAKSVRLCSQIHQSYLIPLKLRDCTNFFREFRKWTLAIIRLQQINILISECQWNNERSEAHIFPLDSDFFLASLIYRVCCPCQMTTRDLSVL